LTAATPPGGRARDAERARGAGRHCHPAVLCGFTDAAGVARALKLGRALRCPFTSNSAARTYEVDPAGVSTTYAGNGTTELDRLGRRCGQHHRRVAGPMAAPPLT
jgi:hypothetical protein